MGEQYGFYRPREQHEGPAESCVIHGLKLGWLNCTCTCTAMGIDQATLGAHRPDDCDIRAATNDFSGGTQLRQTTSVASLYGVDYELHTGTTTLATPAYLAGQLRLGRGVEWQGGAGALIGSRYQSTGAPVNHCVHVNEGRGWHKVGGVWLPHDVLVFDPAADSRHAGWGQAADAADWWPWDTLLRYGAALEPNGEGTGRLGTGRVYSAILPAPRRRLRYTGSATAPLQYMAADPPAGRRIIVRSGPSKSYPRQTTLGRGDTFVQFQRNAQGQSLDGSRVWIGSQDGTLWVHESGLR